MAMSTSATSSTAMTSKKLFRMRLESLVRLWLLCPPLTKTHRQFLHQHTTRKNLREELAANILPPCLG